MESVLGWDLGRAGDLHVSCSVQANHLNSLICIKEAPLCSRAKAFGVPLTKGILLEAH